MDEEVVTQHHRELVRRKVHLLDFSFYTSEEARKLSVREITEPTQVDRIGRPLPGGLYDPALGPILHTASCETCGLTYRECPGHCGHIELAAPLVHPFLTRALLQVLRAKCWFCHRYRCSALDSRKAVALLKAVQLDDEELRHQLMEFLEPSESEDRFYEVEKVVQQRWLKYSMATPNGLVRDHSWNQDVDSFLRRCASTPICPHCEAKSFQLKMDRDAQLMMSVRKQVEAHNRALGKHLRTLAIKDRYENESSPDLGLPEVGQNYRIVPNIEIEAQLGALQEQEQCLNSFLWHRESKEPVFLVKVLIVPPSRFRPIAVLGEGNQRREHPQNVHLQKILMRNRMIRESIEQSDGSPVSKQLAMVHEMQLDFNRFLSGTGGSVGRSGGSAIGLKQILERKEGLFRMNMMGKRVNFSARSVIGPDPFLMTAEIGVPLSFAKRLTVPVHVSTASESELKEIVARGPLNYPGANSIEEADGKVMRLRPGFRLKSQSKLLGQGNVDGRRRVFRHLRDGDFVLFNRQPSLHRPSIMAHRVRILPTEKTLRMHYVNCGSYNADFDGDEMNMHVPQDFFSRAEAAEIALADRQYITPTSGSPIRGLIQDHVLGGVLLTKKNSFFTREECQQLVYSACEYYIPRSVVFHLPAPCIVKPRPLWSGKQVVSLVVRIIGRGPPLSVTCKTRMKDSTVGRFEGTVLMSRSELIHGILDKSQVGASGKGLVHSFYELYGPDSAGALLSAFGRLFTLFLRTHGHTTGVDDLLLDSQAEHTRKEQQGNIRRFLGAEVIQAITSGRMTADPALAPTQLPSPSQSRRMVSQLLSRSHDIGEALLDKEMKKALGRMSSILVEDCLAHGVVKKFPRNGFLLMTDTGAKGSKVNTAQISCQLGQTELEGRRVPRSSSGATLPFFSPFDASARAGGYISNRFLSGIRPPEYFLHSMAGREGLVDTAVKTARSGYLQRCLIKHLEGVTLAYDSTVRNSDGSIVQFRYGGDGLDPIKITFLQRNMKWAADNLDSLWETYSVGCNVSLLNDEKQVNDFEDGFGVDARKFAESNLSSSTRSRFEDMAKVRVMNARAEPGDALGILAAQSIGEPSTQMTLNTFHFAGMGAAHVTLGIPRLRELLLTATRSPNTPTMSIKLLPDATAEVARSIARKFTRICVGDLLEGISVKDQGPSHAISGRELRVRLHFPSEHIYANDLGISHRHLFEACVANLTKRVKAQLASVARKAVAGVLPSVTGSKVPLGKASVEEETHEDDEAETSRKAKRARTDADDQSKDSQSSGTSAGGSDVDSSSSSSGSGESGSTSSRSTSASHSSGSESKSALADTSVHEPEEDEVGDIKPTQAGSVSGPSEKPAVGVRGSEVDVRSFDLSLDVPNLVWGRIMIPELVSVAARASVIQEVPGIRKCFVEERDGLTLTTEGSNPCALWDFADIIDVNELTTNDVYGVSMIYGIEAAQATLEAQLRLVFDAYGISVDARHISLLASYATFTGEYLAFNRSSMQACPSSLQKMSFESCVPFLTNASLANTREMLQSPSAQICTGQLAHVGTGCFEVLQRLPV